MGDWLHSKIFVWKLCMAVFKDDNRGMSKFLSTHLNTHVNKQANNLREKNPGILRKLHEYQIVLVNDNLYMKLSPNKK